MNSLYSLRNFPFHLVIRKLILDYKFFFSPETVKNNFIQERSIFSFAKMIGKFTYQNMPLIANQGIITINKILS